MLCWCVEQNASLQQQKETFVSEWSMTTRTNNHHIMSHSHTSLHTYWFTDHFKRMKKNLERFFSAHLTVLYTGRHPHTHKASVRLHTVLYKHVTHRAMRLKANWIASKLSVLHNVTLFDAIICKLIYSFWTVFVAVITLLFTHFYITV